MKYYLFSILTALACLSSFAQDTTQSFFDDISLQIDTAKFTIKKDFIDANTGKYLTFRYKKNSVVALVNLICANKKDIKKIVLIKSGDYEIVDSLIKMSNENYQFKVHFINLTTSNFLNFKFRIFTSKADTVVEIKLFPYIQTSASVFLPNDELYIGEEKILDINTDNPENIWIRNEWTNDQDIDYRITQANGQLKLHLLPNVVGTKSANVKLTLIKPYRDSLGKMCYEFRPPLKPFTIKKRRFLFLNVDKKEIIMDETSKKDGIEIQIDNYRNLQLKKTYRLESSEEAGGTLIAEIFTLSSLVNNRVLCRLRTYNYHKQSDGYLFVKDGDEAKFLTNFSIISKTTINKISILKKGTDWSEDNNINPGETATIKLEGENFQRAHFIFDGLADVVSDSLQYSDKSAVYKIKIPMNIAVKKITIYNNKENTGNALNIKEFLAARPFDYININFGESVKNVSQITSPEIITKSIKNINLIFLQDKIDSLNKMYGKQYLSIDIKVTGKDDQVKDIEKISTFCVCPGSASPRHTFYDCKECLTEVSLNSSLDTKIYDLSGWTKISLTIKNDKDKYNDFGYEKKVDIILQKPIKYDVDVSFPSLLTYVQNEGWRSDLGVSMAIVEQFSFYDKKKVGKLKPFKIGAGFLALNAFNLSATSTRDLGLVVLANVSPTNTERKFSFPLYLGGGYLLNAQKWFYVVGPGIGVSF